MSDLAFVASYGEIRSRLRNPPNAVPDEGIDLKRPKVIPIKDGHAEQEITVIELMPTVDLKEIEEQIGLLEDRLYRLRCKHNILAEKKPPASLVIETVARHFDVTPNDLKSASRAQHVTFARQVAMFLCRTLTPLSLPGIGKVFGGRDHTTAMHAVRKITALCESDPDIHSLVQVLANQLKSHQ